MSKHTEELEAAFLNGQLPEQAGTKPKHHRWCRCTESVYNKRTAPNPKCEHCGGTGVDREPR